MESYRSQLLTGATDDHEYDYNEDHICDDYDDQIDHQEREMLMRIISIMISKVLETQYDYSSLRNHLIFHRRRQGCQSYLQN